MTLNLFTAIKEMIEVLFFIRMLSLKYPITVLVTVTVPSVSFFSEALFHLSLTWLRSVLVTLQYVQEKFPEIV